MGAAGLVAVLFTDLVGSTETGARLGEERADRLRHDHFALLREAIAAHHGTEVKNLGDGLMVVFGAASDAVACAVAMQQAVTRRNRRAEEAVEMRVGVAAGEATSENDDYFGTPVVEAARVCAEAGPAQVLVTDMARLLTGSRGGHRFDSLGPLPLKGLPDPVTVHRLAWEPVTEDGPPLPARLATETPGFVGRAAESEILQNAWKEARQGERRLVLIAGEPGIGKTTLSSRFARAAHADGALVLLGTCDEDLAVPYQPFVEALRHLVTCSAADDLAEVVAGHGGELLRLLPVLAERVSGLVPAPAADPETERYLLFNAVCATLAAASRQRPVVLFLDDLHWATQPTVLLLRHLVRAADAAHLLVIGTYRDSDVGRGHPLADVLADLRREEGVTRLALRGLSDTETLDLMETLAGHDMSDEYLGFAQAVYAETDGSPFFMRELFRHMIESGDLVQEGSRWTVRTESAALEIPESVREVIGRRLSRLPEDTERLLTLGAVIGRRFDVGVLAPLAGRSRSEVAEALEPARRARLVEEVEGSSGQFSFVHALIRHTLYSELGTARRMELHRAVAETLESVSAAEPPVAELAHHWAAATAAPTVARADHEKAARYSEEAGRRAMASLGYEEAAQHFAAALRTPGNDSHRCDLLIALGEAQRCTGDAAYRETLLDATRLALDLGDAIRAARAALGNQRPGMFSRYAHVDDERVEALEATLAALGPESTPTRARLLAVLASELQFTPDTERRQIMGGEALAIARACGDDSTLAPVLASLYYSGWAWSSAGERLEMAAELDQVARRLGEVDLLFMAAVFLTISGLETGDVARATAAGEEATRIADQLGQPTLRWRATILRGAVAMVGDHFDELEQTRAEAQRLGELAGQPDAAVFGMAPLAFTRLVQGRFAEAHEIMEQFQSLAVTDTVKVIDALALAGMGDHDAARALVQEVCTPSLDRIAADYTYLLILWLLGPTCLILDEPAIAEQAYERLCPHRTAYGTASSVWLGPVAFPLGTLATVIGRYDEADDHFQCATEMAERVGSRSSLVHIQWAWAEMRKRRGAPGDRDQTQAQLPWALETARELELTGMIPLIEALLA